MSALFRILRTTSLTALTLCLLTATLWAAPTKPQLQITGYLISADLDPSVNRLSATADVTFTALEELTTPTFELNNGLQITKVTDAQGHPLESERLTNNSTVRFTLAAPIPKGTSTTFHFTYAGTLKGSETSPVEGIKLASIEDPISILLYPGRWFPMTGLFTNRFTAEMHIRVPGDERVVGSGSGVAAQKSLPGNRTEFTFKWTKPGFPGTIIAGKFLDPITAGNMRVYVTEKNKEAAHDFASTAERQYLYLSGTFGQPESTHMSLVELPDDAVSAAWAPEIAAIAGGRITARNEQRLLSNTLAHQWWGSQVSPATLNDAWITNGMSRYTELMYLEDSAGKTAFQNAITDISAGALAYDTEPLTTIGRLDPFSPQFQSMTLEKGAMVFHMLRWEVGDKAFQDILKSALSQYAGGSITTDDFERVAEAQSQQQLVPFFSQWIDGTGAPTFANKYSVYRLGNNKGFRTIGEINQDLDLFRMPVDLRIETDGKTVNQSIEVVGTDTQYVVDTFGRPRRISVDPNDWVLKSSPDLQVRISILKGQQLVAQNDLLGALAEYKKAVDANPQSSLASYRIGEVLFTECNYQGSVNAFRDALHGDDEPPWT